MDRKGLEIVKFLLDWHDLLTEPPVNGLIPEIYFCFVCSVYSKGKDKVSWLQFMKYLRLIDKLCSGYTLVCVPCNALSQHYEDLFRCFDRISYINRLSLALLLRTTQSLNYAYVPPSSPDSNRQSNSPSPSILSTSSASTAASVSLAVQSAFNDPSSITQPPSSSSSSEDYNGFESNHPNCDESLDFEAVENIDIHFKRKSLNEVNYQIPTNKNERLNFHHSGSTAT
ncbi:hypothetical protein PMKS-000386 [Pichia membranifaciens]|uniref:Uncharacterized protein n=1 Tax=Pichia membranifaciens TaxID=4926 RepID=A0A1Q2YBL6_9ASCO|nr:hypothetical protein PMKS-000386 [Pichia membranifaciens]